MRVFVAMLGLVLALLLQAGPAAAHGVTTVQDQQSIADLEHHQDHQHDGSETHDPTNHTHPFGEDPLHELMFHSSGVDHVGFAAYSTVMLRVSTKMPISVSHVSLSGITVSPLLRPPLA